jgi:hypothetical protein
MKKTIFNGQYYSSLSALHAEHASPSVSYQTFINRHKSGETLNEALTRPVEQRKFVLVEGVQYNLKELAAHRGISYEAVIKRVERGWSDEEIAHGKLKTVKVPKKENIKLMKSFIVSGIEYENVVKAYDAIKPVTSLNTVRARLRSRFSPEEAFDLLPRVKTRADQIRSDQKTWETQTTKGPFLVEDKQYATIAELADTFRVPYSRIWNRLKAGWNPEKAVLQKPTTEVEFDGVKYRSAHDAWTQIGQSSSAVYNSRKSAGHSLPVCLGLQPLPSQVWELYGERYDSLEKVAQKWGIGASVLKSRIQRGMSMEEALEFLPFCGRYNSTYFENQPEEAAKTGSLYLVAINFPQGPRLKIGVTKQTLKKRLSGLDFTELLKVDGLLPALVAIERRVCEAFNQYRKAPNGSFSGRTETFICEPGLREEIEKSILEMHACRNLN